MLLNVWFQNMDNEFDEKLRSDNFVNLSYNKITNSLDLYHYMYELIINPPIMYHDIFDFYLTQEN
jgi:hypothetical protein